LAINDSDGEKLRRGRRDEVHGRAGAQVTQRRSEIRTSTCTTAGAWRWRRCTRHRWPSCGWSLPSRSLRQKV